MLRKWATLVALALAGGALVPPTAAAQAVPCSYGGGYPGDSAANTQLAAWLASGAIRAGLPGELPVMGALVESGLQNLRSGDADSAGFFQMRIPIWDQGEYAGFPANPDLQLKWFIDQAIAVNRLRAAAGLVAYGADPGQWGAWAADVLRPPEQYRGRYQLRLEDARALLLAGCARLDLGGGASPVPKTDSTSPVVRVAGKRIQDPVARGVILVQATCPAEACVASAHATLSIPGAAKVHRIRSSARQIPRGGSATLKLRVKPALRRAIRRALRTRRRLRARIVVTAKDAFGNTASTRRVIALVHR
jgi:hypothetical protein